ncbi:MAG TPA: flippase-like domain-containing protein [Deltaproteobacteria bacterium]|nr:flippase-like domain-containing protein [Deltaproteobacteria bacterium]
MTSASTSTKKAAAVIKEAFFKYWLLFFLALVGLYAAMARISFMDLWQALGQLALWQLGVLLSIYLTISCLNILLRKYLLDSMGQNPRVKNLFLIHFTSMAAHYSTPAKLGFPIIVLLLNKMENISYSVGTSAVFVELVVSTAICGIIGTVGTIFYFAEGRLLVGFLGLLAALLLTFLMGSWIQKKNPDGRTARSVKKLIEGVRCLSLRHIINYSVMRMLVQLCAAINLFLICRFFSVNISYPIAVVVGSSAFFIGAISMIPMGLGVREGSVLLYLAKFGFRGAEAISVVTVQRLISTGFTFLVGILLSALFGTRKIIKELSRY